MFIIYILIISSLLIRVMSLEWFINSFFKMLIDMHSKITYNYLWILITSSTTNNVRMLIRSQFKSTSNSTFVIGISRDSTQRLARHYDLNMLVGRHVENAKKCKLLTRYCNLPAAMNWHSSVKKFVSSTNFNHCLTRKHFQS